MDFSINGGGGLEFHLRILKNDFKKKHLDIRIIPWLWKRALHLIWALYYVYTVVEVTMNNVQRGEERRGERRRGRRGSIGEDRTRSQVVRKEDLAKVYWVFSVTGCSIQQVNFCLCDPIIIK